MGGERQERAIPAKSKAQKFNDAKKQGENGWLSTSLACVSWSWAHDVSVFVVRSESIESVLVPLLSRTTMSNSSKRTMMAAAGSAYS